jgi:hypothetical protein
MPSENHDKGLALLGILLWALDEAWKASAQRGLIR